MLQNDVATAMHRVEMVLKRRPETGLHDDAPATARWRSGTRVVASHANGTRIESDMPTQLGGSGDRITPGWLFRAGLASCTATCIALHAASLGIALEVLEVETGSRSDLRGLLGMTDTATGAPVDAGPGELWMNVRVAAPGVPDETLRALVVQAQRCSPIAGAATDARPIALRIDVTAA